MECQGDIHAAALAIAGDERFVRVVEGRLRGIYEKFSSKIKTL